MNIIEIRAKRLYVSTPCYDSAPYDNLLFSIFNFQENYGEEYADELRKTNRFVPDKEFSGTDRSAGASRSGELAPISEFFFASQMVELIILAA